MPSKPKAILLEGVEGLAKSKKVGCNTLALEYKDGRKALRYHYTDVITDYPNGNTVLNTGGWHTSTTKLRLQSRYQVWSDRGFWYIKEPATGNKLPYYDGITFNSKGKVVGKIKEHNVRKVKAIKAKIAKYVKLIDRLDTIPMPNAGDCFYCQMHTQEGNSLGDATKDYEHLESHLKESYIFGSIIYNALKKKGYTKPEYQMRMNLKDTIKRALRVYLTKRLLPEIQVR